MSDTRKAVIAEAGGGGHDDDRRKIERRAKTDIRRVLGDQLDRVMGAVYVGMVMLSPSFWEHETPIMQAAMLPILTVIVRKAVQFAVGDLEETVHVGVDQASMQARLSKWARTYTYELIKGIDGTTRTAVREAMRNWAIEGGTTTDLRKALEPTFGSVRAQMIAETETTRAFSAAHRESWEESRVVEAREWRTAMDERVCPICGALDGAQAVLGQPFILAGVGEYDDPPAHPRCRCWTVPVIREVSRLG